MSKCRKKYNKFVVATSCVVVATIWTICWPLLFLPFQFVVVVFVSAVVSIVLILSGPEGILCLLTEGFNRAKNPIRSPLNAYSYAASFFSFFCFCFLFCCHFTSVCLTLAFVSGVQFLSCLLIVKVAEALFNSFRDTFLLLL